MKNSFQRITCILVISTMSMLLCSCASSLDSPPEDNSSNQPSSKEILDSSHSNSANQLDSNAEQQIYHYDALQSIFLEITPDTTTSDLVILITENSLSFTTKEYNKTSGGKTAKYKLAYNDGVARQSHADSGDYLEVSFDLDNSSKIMFAQYVSSMSLGYTALFYNCGTWYDFNDNVSEDYSGYYIHDVFSKKGGITISSSNGNETATNYFKYSSAEEVIQKVIDNTEKSF